jgi:hypothetical protein
MCLWNYLRIYRTITPRNPDPAIAERCAGSSETKKEAADITSLSGIVERISAKPNDFRYHNIRKFFKINIIAMARYMLNERTQSGHDVW